MATDSKWTGETDFSYVHDTILRCMHYGTCLSHRVIDAACDKTVLRSHDDIREDEAHEAIHDLIVNGAIEFIPPLGIKKTDVADVLSEKYREWERSVGIRKR